LRGKARGKIREEPRKSPVGVSRDRDKHRYHNKERSQEVEPFSPEDRFDRYDSKSKSSFSFSRNSPNVSKIPRSREKISPREKYDMKPYPSPNKVDKRESSSNNCSLDDWSQDGEFGEKISRRKVPKLDIGVTTAASEFIYGTSAVTAALKSGNRQCYTLYLLLDPEKRNDKNAMFQQYANLRGAKTIRVAPDQVSELDRISKGRPHNVTFSHHNDSILTVGRVLYWKPLLYPLPLYRLWPA
jgi:hypothetical protein